MKIKQFSFSLDYAQYNIKNTSKLKQSSHNRTSSDIISQKSSSFYNSQSNKRLKYYSTRNKEEIHLIDQDNLNILKQEFKKFNNINLKGFLKGNFTHKKDVFNLIAKKYYGINKINSTQKINHNHKQKIAFSTISYLTKDQNKNNQSLQFQDSKIRNIESSFKPVDPASLYPLNQQKISNLKQIQQNIPFNPLNHLQNSKISKIKNLTTKSQNRQRKIMILDQRLKRHRFNKSSISKINYPQGNLQNKIKIDNFMGVVSISQLKSSQKYLNNHKLLQTQTKYSKTQTNSVRNMQSSKRYVALKGNTIQTQININPYTQQKYLHFQIQAQNKQLKTIQKIIHTSYSSNMAKSFHVTPINPQINKSQTCRGQKNNIKNEILKKVKNLSTINVRKQIKNKISISNKKHESNGIQGWQVDNKQIDYQDEYIS